MKNPLYGVDMTSFVCEDHDIIIIYNDKYIKFYSKDFDDIALNNCYSVSSSK